MRAKKYRPCNAQCKFLFPARKGALIRQIRDGDACGRAALRALAREKFRVRTKKLFGFVLKNTANPLAPAVGGAGRRGGGWARRANDARPRFAQERRLPLVYATGGACVFSTKDRRLQTGQRTRACARSRGRTAAALTPRTRARARAQAGGPAAHKQKKNLRASGPQKK